MRGDGDGWVTCALGHRHWGRYGAAGLLLRAVEPTGTSTLLQHRALWSHEGGTWGVPGGARDSDETPEQAALREAAEEAAVPARQVRVRGRHRVDHGGWHYDTVIADIAEPVAPVAQHESVEVSWVREVTVPDRPLHPGFAAAWPRLATRPVTLVVDAANVVGSRPDGWWRDRAGATRRLRDALRALPGSVREDGDGGWVAVRDVVLVVEGRAAEVAADGPDGAGPHDRVSVVPAPGSGDDSLAELAHQLADALVVTADRGLRARVTGAATVAGPSWLLALLDPTPDSAPDPAADPAPQPEETS